MKTLLSDVTSVLKTISVFIAPIVLGVVATMQNMISSSMSGGIAGINLGEETMQAAQQAGINIEKMAGVGKMAKQGIESGWFIIIMGVYVIIMVVLLTYFSSQIEETKNKIYSYYLISKYLPMAVLLYILVILFVSPIFSSG